MIYSGDTEPCPRVAALAYGADLLIHEYSFPEPFDVSMIKNRGVKRTVLTHLYPEAQECEDGMHRH